MSWRERIRAAREEQKLTREQVINKMRLYMKDGKGIAVRTLIAWESGESEPRVTQAIALARALGYNEVSRLFAEPDTPQLNKAGLDMLESYRNLLMLAPQYRENPHPVLRVLPVYLQPASAGTGQWLDDDMADQSGRFCSCQRTVWCPSGGRFHDPAVCRRADRVGKVRRNGG